MAWAKMSSSVSEQVVRNPRVPMLMPATGISAAPILWEASSIVPSPPSTATTEQVSGNVLAQTPSSEPIIYAVLGSRVHETPTFSKAAQRLRIVCLAPDLLGFAMMPTFTQ